MWAFILRELPTRLRQKGVGYWVRLLITIVLAKSLVGWMDTKGELTEYRSTFYQTLQRMRPFPQRDKNTVVVHIDDEEYWKGDLDRRVPIKRDYLAHLVEKLDAADAKVIALDFDLRSPSPDGKPLEAPDYVAETAKLLETVKAVSVRRAVVLPKTVSEEDGDYVLDSDIYDGFVFGPGKVFKGYILLPYDHLRVPVVLNVGGGSLDSFSMAVVRAFQSKALGTLPKGDDLPYGSFMAVAEFDRIGASDVLTEDPVKLQKLRDMVYGRVVLVGGAWNRRAYGRGPTIDSHETPIGPMPGVYVHANFVESILNDKAFPPLTEAAVKTIEWLLIIMMAIAFAAGEGGAAQIKFVGASWVLLAVMSYFFFINLGIVFDLFVPALSVTVHWLFEQGWEALQGRLNQWLGGHV
jgi:CHASE2 domain-containing sensor protein